MNRTDILDRAADIVNGEREEQYGTPEASMDRIARMWNAYLIAIPHGMLAARDVAAMLALMKIARIRPGQCKLDTWIDLAGYAAIGGELDEVPPMVKRISTDEEARA